MVKSKVRSRRGYTLTEAMITVAITAILASVSAPLLVQMTNFWRQTTARNNIQRDVRVSLDTINRFVRQGVAQSFVLDQVANQPPSSRITFYTVQSTSTWVSFYQKNNQLYMKNGAAVSVLTSNLAYVAFSYPRTDDPSLISVALTTQSSTYKGGFKALQLSIEKVRIMN